LMALDDFKNVYALFSSYSIQYIKKDKK